MPRYPAAVRRVLLLLLLACGSGHAGTPTTTTEPQPFPRWIAGSWRSADDAFEVWLDRGDHLLGVQWSDAGLGELARIDAAGYFAVPRAQAPTQFRIESLEDHRARFVAPEHDFPTWITYERVDTSLRARIGDEDGERAQWRMERVATHLRDELRELEVCRDQRGLHVQLPGTAICAALAGELVVALLPGAGSQLVTCVGDFESAPGCHPVRVTVLTHP